MTTPTTLFVDIAPRKRYAIYETFNSRPVEYDVTLSECNDVLVGYGFMVDSELALHVIDHDYDDLNASMFDGEGRPYKPCDDAPFAVQVIS
tara:strand:- start:334 stop:606 length:273 start_codon:yes stop_codon:yes gene_type:complete